MARRAILATTAAALAALALPAASTAGGWATVGLETLPAGVGAGDTWVAEATILQHGRTPLEGVKPRVLIDDGQGGSRAFAAAPTSEPGVYRADVVFPQAGSWRVSVDDGFSLTHSFGEFQIGAAGGATAEGGGVPVWAALGLSFVAGGVAFALVALGGRRRGSAARPAPAEG